MGRHAKGRPSHDGQDKEPVLQVIWRTGVWKLFPFLLVYSTGFATLFPVIPTLITNGFASQAAGHFVDCQLYTPATSPIECRNAHSQAVIWNSWTSFVSGSILAFVCAPFVGRLSDYWGRKPFMFAGVSLALMPMIVLMFFTWGWVCIEWYYPFSALNGMVSSFGTSLTSVADLLHQAHRATAIGYLSACFSIGILIGPVLGGYISTEAAVYVCIGMITATLGFIAFIVPETAPRVLARRQGHRIYADGQHEAAAGEQLDEPLLNGHSSEPCSPRDTMSGCAFDENSAASNARKLGEMDFDPIPNVVAHAHEHTLMVNVALCDAAAIVCDSTIAMKRDVVMNGAGGIVGGIRGDSGELESHATVPRQGSAWPRKPLDLPCSDIASQPSTACGRDAGQRRALKCSHKVLTRSWSDMLVGWRVIQGSPYYRKLVIIFVIVAMTWEGSQDLLMQYLQLQLGFTTVDQAHLLIVVAACGLAIKVLFLATLVRVLGEQRLLMLGLTAYMFEDILLAIVPSKAGALLAIAVGSVSCVCWPATVAMQTRHADPCDMGAVQGALSGISSLATGIGPIGFAALFAAFSRSDSSLPYFPQVVWYLAAVLSLLAILVAGTLHWSEPKTTVQDKQPDSTAHSPTPMQRDDQADGTTTATDAV